MPFIQLTLRRTQGPGVDKLLPQAPPLERLLPTLPALVGSVVCGGGPGLGKALLWQEAWGTVIWGTQPSCALRSSPGLQLRPASSCQEKLGWLKGQGARGGQGTGAQYPLYEPVER